MNRKITKKLLVLGLSGILACSMVFTGTANMTVKSVSADTLPTETLGSGSIGYGSNDGQVAKLPTIANQGKYRFTTDYYNSTHPALDTTDWATNFLWSTGGDRTNHDLGALSGTAYALPLNYLMKTDGMRVTKASMTSNNTNISAYTIMDNDTLSDFKISPDWTCNASYIDDSSDWTYTALAPNPSDTSQNMKTTMVQGSPFGYFELTNSNVIYVERLRAYFNSSILYEDTYEGAKVLVFRTWDNVSAVNGYPTLTNQYYALFLPEGAVVDHQGSTDMNDGIGKLKITLPAGHTYLSFAWLCEDKENSEANKSMAVNIAKDYRPYAFNFITGTKADYSFDENTSKLTTTYTYSFAKKAESTADGTIMGLLPHQYKNMSGYNYLSQQAITIRGYMKFMMGSSYQTVMDYEGILPYMPELPESDTAGRATLQNYVNQFVASSLIDENTGGETYYHGKTLNKAAQAVAAAHAVGDKESAEIILEGLEANLANWFTYSGDNDKKYFTYYGNGVGSLLGFPSSFNSIDQLNDHHFHYGYFIESAASVGLWDKAWLNEYKDVVKQLIYDIACPYRENSEAKCGYAYPYLRSFAPYEGHSWASGFSDERTGNNQESTSEAINAWAGIILFGEVTGDKELRDLGIYLYTTEVAASDQYWFDKDDEIYHIDSSNYEPPMASMVWGGKVDYATWFGIQYTQGIQICPMQSWSFYFLTDGKNISGKDYIINKYYDYDKNNTVAAGGSTEGWNDMWAAYYALADPETAMNSIWTKKAVNDGESQAHTYHYIQSMIDYGTPDLSYRCDSTLGTVFTKNGKQTFVVYNPSNASKNVTFTSSTNQTMTVKAAAGKMTIVNSDNIGKSTYTVEYYGKNLNGNDYTMLESDVLYADAGTNVTAPEKNITGYLIDWTNNANVMSGRVTADGNLTLKVYYNRASYFISYDLDGGTMIDPSLYPVTYTYGQSYELDKPVKEGYDFYAWYKDAALTKEIKNIKGSDHENLTLYARWLIAGTVLNGDVELITDQAGNMTFNLSGALNYNAANLLYKVSNTEAEAKKLVDDWAEIGFVSHGAEKTDTGWSATINLTGQYGKYVTAYFIKYDNFGGYKTEYVYGKIGGGAASAHPGESQEIQTPQSEIDDSVSAPVGLVVARMENDVFAVMFAQVTGYNSYGLYVDGQFIKSIYNGEWYNAKDLTNGHHQVQVTTITDKGESRFSSAVTIEVLNGQPGEETTPDESEQTTDEVTGPAADKVSDVEDLVVEIDGNTITISFNETPDQQNNGQKYNIYIDGLKIYSNVAVGTYILNNFPAGEHTIKITAVLNGEESDGVERAVFVEGNIVITDPEENTPPETSRDETTTSNTVSSENTTSEIVTTKSAEQLKLEVFQQSGKVKIKKVTKKKSAKKVKIALKKKVNNADGYQVRFYKTKKNAKKNKKPVAKITYRKNKKTFTISNKKLKKQKTLFLRVRGYLKVGGKTYYGKWSATKKVTIK